MSTEHVENPQSMAEFVRSLCEFVFMPTGIMMWVNSRSISP